MITIRRVESSKKYMQGDTTKLTSESCTGDKYRSKRCIVIVIRNVYQR